MELTATVDRIEGDLAVLEVAGTTVDWPVVALPDEAAEGSRLLVVLSIAPTDLGEAEERLARLRAKGPAGDIIDL